MPTPIELAPGLWSWAARHPEWHPGSFGAEVVGFAALGDEGRLLTLIDPLLPPQRQDSDGVHSLIDASGAERLAILITIPYHVRSTEPLWERYRASHQVSIHAHSAARKRLGASAQAFEPIEPGAGLPGGATAFAIGKPRRHEQPLHLPDHDALVFGDTVVGVGGELRVWTQRDVDEKVLAFHRERFNPTLEPLVELGVGRALMTHGPSILSEGAAALQAAIDAPPWYHRG